MNRAEHLANELKKYNCICYYPSSGADLSNLDYFASGKKPLAERNGDVSNTIEDALAITSSENDPDLFIHTDVNFYHEFEAGTDLPAEEYGIHGEYEILSFRELPTITTPNLICRNFEHSGRCFEYKLKLWNKPKIRTLIFCLCENEYLVAKILLAYQIKTSFIWSRNWNGSQTHGTWLTNTLNRLGTKKVYSDWLCIQGSRGEPSNRLVKEKYPELMVATKVKLVRNNDRHWIDEGAHGWVEEFDVATPRSEPTSSP